MNKEDTKIKIRACWNCKFNTKRLFDEPCVSCHGERKWQMGSNTFTTHQAANNIKQTARG